jgi:hypothetical protein
MQQAWDACASDFVTETRLLTSLLKLNARGLECLPDNWLKVGARIRSDRNMHWSVLGDFRVRTSNNIVGARGLLTHLQKKFGVFTRDEITALEEMNYLAASCEVSKREECRTTRSKLRGMNPNDSKSGGGRRGFPKVL